MKVQFNQIFVTNLDPKEVTLDDYSGQTFVTCGVQEHFVSGDCQEVAINYGPPKGESPVEDHQ